MLALYLVERVGNDPTFLVFQTSANPSQLSFHNIWWPVQESNLLIPPCKRGAFPFGVNRPLIWCNHRIRTDTSLPFCGNALYLLSYLAHLVGPSGIEPDSSVLQTDVVTTSTKVPYLVQQAGIEPATHGFSVHCSTN